MSFQLFTDSSANLPEEWIQRYSICVTPLTLNVNGESMPCYDPAGMDTHAFYERMRRDGKLTLKTSMINASEFVAAWKPALKAGNDVLYVGMSSGISGTYGAAESAAGLLASAYPERRIATVDTRGASLGEGLLVLEAAELREAGKNADETAAYLTERRAWMRQHFLLDDLLFLKRGGRIKGGAALAGTIMNVKPIMKADEEGHIVLDRKMLGRKKGLRTLADIFDAYHVDGPENRRAAIAHGDCEEDALALAMEIKKRHPKIRFTFVCYEPGTGAHVGPGTVALFFYGKETEKPALLSGIKEKIVEEAGNLREGISEKIRRA